jgi:GLPGLI family protein
MNIYAQKSVKVTYEQITTFREGFFDAIPENTREQTKKAMTSPVTFELLNNDEVSLFKTADFKDILIPATGITEVGTIDQGTVLKLPEVWILKDFKKQKTLAKRNIGEKNYYIVEDFQKEDFIFTNEIQTIENYKCKMAYSFPKNKPNDTIKHWYTDDIPVFDGTYYTVGIPGLILKYERKNRVVYATKIEFFDYKINIKSTDKNTPLVSEKEFETIREKGDESKSYTDENGHKVSTSTIKIAP